MTMKKYIFAHPWLLTFASIFGFAFQGLFVISSVLYMNIIDAISTGDQSAFFSLIIMAAGVVLLYGVALTVFPRFYVAYDLKSSLALKKDVFESVMNTNISSFKKDNSAKYISMINNDIEEIEGNYFSSIPGLIRDAGSLILAVGVMAVISPINAIISALTSALPIAIPLLFGTKLSRTYLESSTSAIYLNQKAKDFLSGFEVIKTFGIEKNIQSKFLSAATRFMKARFRSATAATDMSALLVCTMHIISFANYFVAGFFVLRGDISVGAVIAVSTLHGGIMGPITGISEQIGALKSIKEINKRVLDIMAQKDNIPRNVKIDSLKTGIILKNLSFVYNREQDESSDEANEIPGEIQALSGVNYTFEKGKKYAIVGQSGSGKSTLTKLIMGYYDNYEGDLLIDNCNIRDINREGLYNVVSVLHQDIFLLDDTLKNNITLYNSYSDEEYRAALQKANLLEVEARLAEGSNTVLGESGNTLSGGERQRVAIARSILKGNEVMILDEATANLDNIIAHDIEKSIIGMKNLTCIFVTHRYNRDILEQCDSILVMKSGELFEHGTFDELYGRKGYFYSLYNVLL